MTYEHRLRAALDRTLPIRCPAGALSLSAEEPSTWESDEMIGARLRWLAEGEERERASEQWVVFQGAGRRPELLSVERIEALLLGLSDALAGLTVERAARFAYPGPSTWIPRAVLEKKRVLTREQYREAFIDALGLREAFLTDDERAQWVSAERCDAIARECFPVVGDRWELSLADASPGPGETASGACVESGGHLKLVLNFISYDAADGDERRRSIRDIKQQEVHALAPERRHEARRFEAFLRGLCDGLALLFASRRDDERLSYSMPCDLFDASLLSLKRAQSREDFFEALCRRKKLDPASPKAAPKIPRRAR